MQRNEGVRLDAYVEQFTILAGAREIGDDQSLSAALVALYKAQTGWRDVDIEGFFVRIL